MHNLVMNNTCFIIQAGIRKDRLVIALEPEAASIYCQHLPPDKITGAIEGFSVADEGSKYLVIDIGGMLRQSEFFFQCD